MEKSEEDNVGVERHDLALEVRKVMLTSSDASGELMDTKEPAMWQYIECITFKAEVMAEILIRRQEWACNEAGAQERAYKKSNVLASQSVREKGELDKGKWKDIQTIFFFERLGRLW